MANKPKRRGTAAETAVAAYLQENGWPYAERRSLAGALDKGDISGTPGLCWEVKSTSCSHDKISYGQFLREVESERQNARAEVGIVVVKPKGRGVIRVRSWIAAMELGEMVRFHSPMVSTRVKHKGEILPSLSWPPVVIPEGHLHRVVYVPPGAKENLKKWQCFLHLSDMVEMLRADGYGNYGTVSSSSAASGFFSADDVRQFGVRTAGSGSVTPEPTTPS